MLTFLGNQCFQVRNGKRVAAKEQDFHLFVFFGLSREEPTLRDLADLQVREIEWLPCAVSF